MKFWLSILAMTSIAGASLSVKDTIVNGIPYVRLMTGEGAEGTLKIDSERGQPRASLEGSADSVLVVFDRNPFARMAGRTRALVLPPRVTKSRLVLPKTISLDLFKRLGLATGGRGNPSKPPPSNPVKPPQNASPVVEQPSTPVVPPAASSPVDPPKSPEAPKETTSSVVAEVDVPDAPAPPTVKKGTFTVVIDAGHGGKDPGANGKRSDGTSVLEKMATLQVARKLRDELAKIKGIRVVMTRDKDVFLELAERTRAANSAKGDLFVSLHCNSLPLNSKRRDEVNGFMVFLLREAKDEQDKAIERRENDAIRYETGERQKKEALSPVEWMLLEHQLNQYTKESERFAGSVVHHLQSEGPVGKERTGAGQAGFFVLVGSLMPSVLIEMGYLSNGNDAEALSEPDRQERIAKGIAKAIDEFRSTRR